VRRLAALLCLFAFPAFAGHYLEPAQIPPTFLFKPWEEQSAEWKKDVQEIMEMQKNAGSEEVRQAAAEKHMAPEMVVSVLGAEYARDRYPVLFELLDKVGEDCKAINNQAKDYWLTRRPYLAASKEVKALIAAHDNPAYPSGHTSGSLLWAEVLGQLFPDKRELLRARANDIAYRRVLVGMHYPVDVQGGRAVARLTLGALWQNEAFKRDFAAAKQEIEKGKH
jgi:acid phosphatase (class A)